MSILDKSIPTQLQNGLNKDLTNQRPGDVTFALNAIRDSHDGGKHEYQSEPGNELVEGLPNGYTFMGSINGIDNEVYIFATDGVASGTIGIFKKGKYTQIVEADFVWDQEYPITGEFRMRLGCERTIYWCNGDAPDGFFNFDSIDDFKTSGVYDTNKFKLSPDVSVPKIDLVSVNDSGGSIPLGSIYFQAEILDANLNSIYKTDITPQTVIYDDNQADAYNNIDGGLNTPQYAPEIGGLPLTSKSITLRLSNLDTSFDFIRINVIRQIAGTQAVDANVVGSLIPISNNSIEWTYTGYNVSSGDYPLDYSEAIIDNINYSTSYVMEQVQNRLLRAGVKQDARDYSLYQPLASLITSQWVAKEIETANQFDLGNPKNPNTYWDCTTFQGDEIYAFGIQYLHKDGSWSPVFHVPGRAAIGSDVEQLTVVTNGSVLGPFDVWESDVEHIDPSDFETYLPGLIGSMIRRWKVFNTASITTSNVVTHPYDYIGEFGYYESYNTNYPNIKDCEDNFIWGEDSEGNPLNDGVKIRHHKFPDRRLVPHVDGLNGAYLVPLGVKFDDIAYPNSDVVGHRFCHANRTAIDKTVVDSGWAVQPVQSSGTIRLDANFADYNETGNYLRYNSADIFFNQNIHNPDYIKMNHAYHIESFPDSVPTIVDKNATDTITAYSYLFLITDKDIPVRTNHDVENQVFVPKGTYTSSSIFGIPIQSLEYMGDDNVLRLSYGTEVLTTILPSQTLGGANITDPVTGTLEYNNFYAYKKVNIKPYENLLNLSYNYLSFNYSVIADDNEFYNGDSIISLSSITRMFWPIFTPDNILQGLCYSTFYEEHQMNPYLRHNGIGPAYSYYAPGKDIHILIDKVADLQSDGFYTLRPFDQQYPEYYGYNKDYTVQSLEKAKVSLPINYDYCSDCLNKFDNYIIFSPKSFDEESFDLYRINKVNDYISLPAHRGRITGLKYQNNYLLTHTEDSLFILQPNPQSLATDISTVYLTTGDFLSIPPQEIMQTDIGYAGMQSKQHMCETPNGHAWCDQKRGQIFMFNSKLEELSTENNGMSAWFKQELPSEMQEAFYQLTESNYSFTSTFNTFKNGIGLIMYYDPRYKRMMITKKDYKPINFQVFSVGPLDYTWYNIVTDEWAFVNSGGSRVTSFSNTSAFENKSWTVSYSFVTNTWTSWHSYRPLAAFSDDTSFYTFATTPTEISAVIQNIWRHKQFNNYQKYYNTKYDFVVEWVAYDISTDNLSTIHYQGNSFTWDSVNKQWLPANLTFDRGICYNNDQSTGLFNLQLTDQNSQPYVNIGFSNLTKHVFKTDENYKISGLYDILTTNPPMTGDWTLVKAYPSYIDQVPFTANHNFNTSAYNLNELRNKFVVCRLLYKPGADSKKVINLIQTNEMRSIR